MISDFLDNVIFNPFKEVVAFIIYWAGWFVVIPIAIWCLYKLINKLYDNIEQRNWGLIAIQALLVIALVFVTYQVFEGFTNTGKEIDPDRPTGIEKSIQGVGEYD